MSKKRLPRLDTDEDVFKRLADSVPLGSLDYKSTDNVRFLPSFEDQQNNIATGVYSDRDAVETGLYYDKNDQAQSITNLDESGFLDSGVNDSGRLLRISDDIVYPDGTLASDRETQKALAQGLDPEFAKQVGISEARSLAQKARTRNENIADVLDFALLGSTYRTLAGSVIKEKGLISYFHPKLQKWVLKEATNEDLEAGYAAVNAYGPRPESENFVSAFVKGVDNAIGNTIPSIFGAYNFLNNNIQALGNYISKGKYESDNDIIDTISNTLSKSYDRNSKQPSAASEDTFGSLEGVSAAIGQGVGSIIQYGLTGNMATGLGALTGENAVKLLGTNGVRNLTNAGMITAGLVLNGGEAYNSAKEAGLSEANASLMALLTGGINTALELEFGSNNLQKWLIDGRGAKELPRIILEETGGDLSKLEKSIPNIFIRAKGAIEEFSKVPIIGTAFEEGSEEFMQSLVSSTGEFLYNYTNLGDPNKEYGKGLYNTKNLSEVFKQAFQEGAIGALVGGLAGVVSKNDIAEKQNIFPFITNGHADLVQSTLREMYEKDYINEETYNNFSDRITKLDSIWNTNADAFSKLDVNNPERANQIKSQVLDMIDTEFNIKQNNASLTKQIGEIKSDSELSEAVKQDKIKQLQIEILNNQDKLQEISNIISDFIPNDNGEILADRKASIRNDINNYVNSTISNISNDIPNNIRDEYIKSLIKPDIISNLVNNTLQNDNFLTKEWQDDVKNSLGLQDREQVKSQLTSLRDTREQEIREAEEAERQRKELELASKKESEEKQSKDIRDNVRSTKTDVDPLIPEESIPITGPDLAKPDEEVPTIESINQKTPTINSRRNEIIARRDAEIDNYLFTSIDPNNLTPQEQQVVDEIASKYDLELAVLDNPELIQPTQEEFISSVGIIADTQDNKEQVDEGLEDGLVVTKTKLSSNIKNETNNKFKILNLDIQRTEPNTISYLSVDKVTKIDYDEEGNLITESYDEYTEDGLLKINEFADLDLQSADAYPVGTFVNVIIPTLAQMEERGLQYYGEAKYSDVINDINEFPIAFTDNSGKILGYLNTQSGLKRLLFDDNNKQASLLQNYEMRETIFNNRNSNFQVVITVKSGGSIFSNKVKRSLYDALGDGTKIASNVEIAVYKEGQFRISPTIASNKNIYGIDDISSEDINGMVFSLIPNAKGEYIPIPMDISRIGSNKAQTIVHAIRLYLANPRIKRDQDLIDQRNEIGDYNLADIKGLYSFVDSISYGSRNAKNEANIFDIRDGKLILGLTPDQVFKLSDIRDNEVTRQNIEVILAKRFYSVKLSNFNNPFTEYNLINNRLEGTYQQDYFDYLDSNSILTTDVQVVMRNNAENLALGTGQPVISISNLIGIPTESIQEPEVITYETDFGAINYVRDNNGDLKLLETKKETPVEEPKVEKPKNKLGVKFGNKNRGQIYEDILDDDYNRVNAAPKMVQALNNSKVQDLFNRFYKKGNKDKFYSELAQFSGKQQVDLLKSIDKNFSNINDMLLDFISDFSYTIEINIAEESYNINELIELRRSNRNSSYYSNLIVPGGTNYTENEIATPAIIPSIKGHAQFATNNGIGWFRSDESISEIKQNQELPNEFSAGIFGGNEISYKLEDNQWKKFIDSVFKNNVDRIEVEKRWLTNIEKDFKESDILGSKTRRILEIQSDLFQKGRDKENLIDRRRFTNGEALPDLNERLELIKEAYDSGDLTLEDYNQAVQQEKDIENTSSPQNSFLQLLNKDNNWVTFFIKSIVQDSVKKGYEKVLFPTGDTASKVEGHSTLEEFKNQKEDRIKELENNIKINENQLREIPDISKLSEKGKESVINGTWKIPLEQGIIKWKDEINQLTQELKRVDGPEGFGALKPIYNFYENQVANILKKQGYNPQVITDEYGNKWNQVWLNQSQNNTIFFDIEEASDLLFVNKDKFRANQQREIVDSIIFQIQQKRLEGKSNVNEILKEIKSDFVETRDYLLAEQDEDANRIGEVLSDILNDFDGFLTKVRTKLKSFGVSIDGRETTSTENNNPDSTENVYDETEALLQKKNYDDEATFSQSSKDTASGHLKVKLALIPRFNTISGQTVLDEEGNPEYKLNNIGLPTYEPLNVIWSDLLRFFQGVPQNKMFETLVEASSDNARYKAVYDAIMNDPKVNIQNEFLVTFSKQQAKFKTVSVTPADKKGNVTISTFGTNRSGAENILLDDWYEQFKESSVIRTDADGNKYINTDIGKKFKQAFENVIQAYKQDKTKNTSNISKLFSTIGISVSQKALDKIKDARKVRVLDNYSLDRWLEEKGRYIADRLAGDLSEEVSEVKLDLNNPFISEISQLQALAKLELVVNPSLYEDSFISGDNKSKYSFVNHTYLSHLVDFLKTNESNAFLNDLLKTPYASESIWIRKFLNNPEFREVFSLEYMDTLGNTYSPNANKPFKSMSTKEKEFTRIGLFQNQGRSGSTFIGIIPSDKTTIPLFTTLTTKSVIDSTGNIGLNSEAMDAMMKVFQSEYNRIYQTQNTESSLAGYSGKGMGSKFITLDVFNKIMFEEDGSLKNLTPNLITSVVKPQLREFTKELLIQQASYWNELGLFNENILDKSYISKNNLQKGDMLDTTLIRLAADYSLNYFLFNFNYTQVIGGDPALYGKKSIPATWINYSKRAAKDIAPGLDPAFKDSNINIIYLKDLKYKSAHLNEYIEALNNENIPYAEINPADAQEYTTLEEHLKVMEALGRLSNEAKLAGDRLIKGEEIDGDIDLILQPMKPVYVGTKIENGINKMYYIKTSSFPLIPSLTKDLEIDKLRQYMESNGVDRAIYESGVKLGLEGDIKSISTNGGDTFKEFEQDSLQKFSIPRSGFRIQQEIPFHGEETNVNEGSQARKLILNNLSDSEQLNINGQDISGKSAKELYERLHVEKINRAFDKLLDDISYNKVTNKFDDLSKLKDILQIEAEERNYPINDIYALQVETVNGVQRFKVPLNFTTNSNRLESILNSLVTNRVIKSELPGFAKVQGSSAGFSKVSTLEEVNEQIKDSIIWVDPKDTKLNYIRKGKNGRNQYADILLPSYFKGVDIQSFIKDDGTLDLERLPEDLLTVIGLRIPTQGYNSMMVFRVKGFLPTIVGDLAIVPSEITTQMGSDFDVDKLFLYRYHYEYKKGKLSKIKYDGDLNNINYKKLSLEQIDNLIIQFFEDRLSDERLLPQILEPNGFGRLPEVADEVAKITGKTNYHFMTTMGQNEIHKSNNDGRSGTGIFSLFSTFLKVSQDAGLRLNMSNVKNPFQFGYKKEDGEVIQLSDFSDLYNVDGTLKSYIISYFQSAAVDNAKEQILGKLNINSNTMGVAGTMAMLGYSEDYIGYFLSQPILRDYVEVLTNQNSIVETTTAETDPYVLTMQKYDFEAKNISEQERQDVFGQVYSTSELRTMLGQNANEKLYEVNQQNILSIFESLNNLADKLRVIQSAINTDTKGLGANMVSIEYKLQQLDILDQYSSIIDNIDYLFDSNTQIGRSSEILGESYLVFSNILPYAKPAYTNIVDNILVQSGNKFSVTQRLIETIYNDLKSFILSNPNILEINDIEAERERLLLHKTSLAKRWDDYSKTSEGRNNLLTQRIKPVFRERESDPDLLKSLNTPASNDPIELNDAMMYALDMFYRGSDVEKGLMKDLITYSLLTGSQFGPNSINKYIPIDLLESYEYGNKLNDIANQFNNSNYFDNFLAQFFQHNPQYAKHLSTDDKMESSLVIPKDRSDLRVSDGKRDFLPKFLSKYDRDNRTWRLWTVDSYTKEDITYKEIDLLGIRRNAIKQYNPTIDINRNLSPSNRIGTVENSKESFVSNSKFTDNSPVAQTKVSVDEISNELQDFFTEDGLTLSTMLDKAIQVTTIPEFKILGEALRPIINKQQIVTIDNEMLAAGRIEGSNYIAINFNSVFNNRGLEGGKQKIASTIIHEAWHLVTVENYDNPKTEEQRKAVEGINNLFKAYLDQVDPNLLRDYQEAYERKRAGNATKDDILLLSKHYNELYPLSNPKEFIAGGLSNIQFVSKLKQNNLWENFKKLILKLLGLNTNLSNDFDVLFSLSLTLASNNTNNTFDKTYEDIDNRTPIDYFMELFPTYNTNSKVTEMSYNFNSKRDAINFLEKSGLEGEFLGGYLSKAVYSIKVPINKTKIPNLKFFDIEEVNEEPKTKSEKFVENNINKLKKQLFVLNNRKRRGDQSIDLDLRIRNIESQIDLLKDNQSIIYAINIAEEQLGSIRDQLEKGNLNKEELNLFESYLGFYSTMDKSIIFDESFTSLNNRVSRISKDASNLMEALRKEQVNLLLEYAKDELNIPDQQLDRLETDLSGILEDVGQLEQLTLGGSRSSSSLIQLLGYMKQKTEFDTNEDFNTLNEEILPVIDSYVAKYKNYDMLLQKDSEGNSTGNLLNKYSDDYYKKLKELKGNNRAYWRFFKDNTSITLTEEGIELYKKDKKEAQDTLSDDDYLSWLTLHDPYSYLDDWNKGKKVYPRGQKKYLDIRPVDKWIDTNYSRLRSLPEDDPARVMYDILDKYLRPLNKKYQNQVNYIPEINRSTISYLMKGSFRGGFRNLNGKIINAFSTNIEPSVVKSEIDEITGEPHKTIPLYMMDNKMSPKDKSYDLGKVLQMVLYQDLAVKHKSNIEPIMDILYSNIRESENIVKTKQGDIKYDENGDIISVKGENKLVTEQAKFMINAFLYNEANKVEGVTKLTTQTEDILDSEGNKIGEKPKKVFAWSKLVDVLISYTRAKGLGLNPFAGIGNLSFAILSNMIHSSGRQEFNEKTMFKGLKVMLDSLIPKSDTQKKVATLMKYFDTLVSANELKYGKSRDIRSTENPLENLSIYELTAMGEYFGQGHTMVSILLYKKIKLSDGTEVSIYDGFDSNGNWKYGENPFSDLNKKFDLIQQIRDTIITVHGNYSEEMKLKERWYGRSALIFRTWLPEAINNRFGSDTTNIKTGVTRRGRYRTIIREGGFLFDEDGKIDLDRIKNNLVWSIGLGSTDMSELDKANMRKNIAELGMIAAISTAILLLKAALADADDEDKTYTTYILNSLMRSQNDLTFFMLPSSFNTVLKDPIPLIKTASDILDVLPASWNLIIGEDTYKTGYRRGDSKFAKEMSDIIPIITQIDRNVSYATNVLNDRPIR